MIHKAEVLNRGKGVKKQLKDGHTTNITNQTGNIVNIFVSGHNELRGLFKEFALFNTEFFKWLSSQKITARQWRILAYLISKMRFENRITITNKEMMEQLKIHKSDLSKDVNKLIDLNIVLKQRIASKTYEFKLNMSKLYLNHAFAYKGNSKDAKKVREHKELAGYNVPYLQQKTLFDDYNIIDKETGEVLVCSSKTAEEEYPVTEVGNAVNVPDENTEYITITEKNYKELKQENEEFKKQFLEYKNLREELSSKEKKSLEKENKVLKLEKQILELKYENLKEELKYDLAKKLIEQDNKLKEA